MICCGQIEREAALEELKKPIYDPEQLNLDYDFVLKKLGFTPKQFEAYIETPGQSHLEFDTEAKYWERKVLEILVIII